MNDTMNDTMSRPLLRVKQDPVSRIVNLEFRRDAAPHGAFSQAQIAQIRTETSSQIDGLDLRPHERAEVEELVERTVETLANGGITQAGAQSLISALHSLVAQINGFGPAVESLARGQEHGSAVLGLGNAQGMLAGAAALLATASDLIDHIALRGHAEPPSDEVKA